MIDIENNPKIKLQDVRKIQELLKRNKKSYDDERLVIVWNFFLDIVNLLKEKDSLMKNKFHPFC